MSTGVAQENAIRKASQQKTQKTSLLKIGKGTQENRKG
jgi:hypothetical protein